LNKIKTDTIVDTNIDKIKKSINISVQNILLEHQYDDEKIAEILENINNIKI